MINEGHPFVELQVRLGANAEGLPDAEFMGVRTSPSGLGPGMQSMQELSSHEVIVLLLTAVSVVHRREVDAEQRPRIQVATARG